ncbi:MAG TPA: SGNH/GDSL hydrolase family protein [Parafilimonas sp.]|nr:SGNH/GDSL hydrolase family protein [Parafilimonas sp.]
MYVKHKICVLASIACFLTGNAAHTDHPGYVENMRNEKQLTWLALGDSYTIGETVQEDKRFPAQAIAMLKADGFNFSQPTYIATTGWTTQDLLNAIQKQPLSVPYDIVSLLIGVNDQYQHLDTAGYRERFTECLEAAIRFAGNNRDHVFVLSIPDYSVTPFAADSDTTQIAKEIDEFNAINKAITLSYNVSYIDITPLTREADDDRSLIANDGLHPSEKEYARWAELLSGEINRILV